MPELLEIKYEHINGSLKVIWWHDEKSCQVIHGWKVRKNKIKMANHTSVFFHESN